MPASDCPVQPDAVRCHTEWTANGPPPGIRKWAGAMTGPDEHPAPRRSAGDRIDSRSEGIRMAIQVGAAAFGDGALCMQSYSS